MKQLFFAWFLGIIVMLPGPAMAAESSGIVLTVQEAVAFALTKNPVIRQANALIQASEATVQSTRADLLPEASLGYGYHHVTEQPIMKLDGTEIQTAHQRLYSWNITVIQPLFTGFALSSKLDIAKLDTTARQLEKDQAVLDLIRNVKSACYHLLLAKRLKEVSIQEVDALSAHQRDAELFLREGLIKPNDLLQAQVALANSIQQREKAYAEVRKAQIHLNRLLNQPLGSAVDILEADDRSESDQALSAEVLGAKALIDRPLMQLLNTSLQQLHHSMRIAKSAYYPSISIFGQYEQSGDDPGGNQNDYTNDHNTSFGMQAQWKFFQSGKTLAEIDNVRRQINALEAGIANHQNQIREEVRNALLDCQTTQKNIDTAASALDQAKENWRITDLQYKQQVATSTDVLDARTFLTQADSNYFHAIYSYLDAVAGLDRAIGKKANLMD